MESLKGLYHADKLDEQSFIDNFTIRLKEFKEIIDNLKQQKQKPLQHFLITGKRGMGKSTLLRRIYLEACTPPLSDKLFAVRLGAEQYRLSRLFKLWELVIEHLGNTESKLLEQKAKLNDSKDYEDNLIHIITDYLTETKKTLLLLIDNFDQFLDKLTAKEKHQLREILIEYPVQIIGNTVFYNEHFKSYNEPFFDFFKPVKLENLDKEEADDFIKLRAENEGLENFDEVFKNQYGKIQTLRILSGGVPRTLLILLSIISKKNTGDAVDYLHEMLEQVTPLYQDRMKSLSPQQQEIMHHLAMHWDRTPVKELAAEIRIPSKSISAQLLALESMGYINKIESNGRNNFYEIDERFFNIWLLMSEAPPYDSKRVIWLTKWLDAFYSNDELKDYASFCHNSLLMAKPANRFLIAQALSESEKLDDGYKRKLVEETTESLKDKMKEVIIWGNAYNKKMTNKAELLHHEISSLIQTDNLHVALSKLNTLEQIDEANAYSGKGLVYSKLSDFKNAEKYYLLAIEKGHSSAMNNLALLYEEEKKNLDKAEKYYLLAVEKGNVDAINNVAAFYQDEKKNLDKAEKYYLLAIEKGNVNAMNKLAFLYQSKKKDFQNAEKYYRLAIEKGNEDAMFNLAFLYDEEKKDFKNAEKYYRLAIEKGNVDAMFNLAILYYQEKKDFKNAEKYYRLAAEKNNDRAMVNLAVLYKNEKKDFKNAEKYYRLAVEKNNDRAMVNLGLLYETEMNDLQNAEKYYLQAVEKGNVDAITLLAMLYDLKKKDFNQAIKYYKLASEKGNTDALILLAMLYQIEKKDLRNTEKYYKLASEKGNTDALFFLANFYYTKNIWHKKEEALKLCNNGLVQIKKIEAFEWVVYINILLWNERVKDAMDSITDILSGPLNKDENMAIISESLQSFMVFRQKQFLYKTFTTNRELIDRYKPVYYALMHEMQDEYPNEYLKMPEELQEPVNKLLNSIKEEQKRLGL